MIQISCFTNKRVTCPPDFAPRQGVSKPSALRRPPGTTIIEELAGSRKWNKVEVIHMMTNYVPYTVLDFEFMGDHVEPVQAVTVEGSIAPGASRILV